MAKGNILSGMNIHETAIWKALREAGLPDHLTSFNMRCTGPTALVEVECTFYATEAGELSRDEKGFKTETKKYRLVEEDNASQLVAPDGWFLHKAAHEHTAILYRGDVHTPLPHAGGPWVVEFQKLPDGGRLTQGRGKTLADAWDMATKKVQANEKLS